MAGVAACEQGRGAKYSSSELFLGLEIAPLPPWGPTDRVVGSISGSFDL